MTGYIHKTRILKIKKFLFESSETSYIINNVCFNRIMLGLDNKGNIELFFKVLLVLVIIGLEDAVLEGSHKCYGSPYYCLYQLY